MMYKHILSLLFLLFGCFSVRGYGQASVEQKIEPVQMMIGEQATLSLNVFVNGGDKVVFPSLKPSTYLTSGVEILEISDVDTVKLDNNRLQLTRKYTLTAFDEHLFPIPGMRVNVNKKVLQGNTCALKVIMPDVDTTRIDQFYPAYPVQSNPFLWSEWNPIFMVSVFMMLCVGIMVYLYGRLIHRKPIISRIQFIRKRLPHEKAIESIEALKKVASSSSADQKEYYTQLSVAIRTYMEERFGFNAMEMTTSEIVDQLQGKGDQESVDELRQLFETADLVKFAKYEVLLNENDRNLMNAVKFINKTKNESLPAVERIVPKLSEADKKVNKDRQMVLAALCVFAMVFVGLLLLLGYFIWDLI